MPKIQQLAQEYEDPHGGFPDSGHDLGEMPGEDPPLKDHPTESYSAWRATAIYDVGSFTSLLKR